MDKLREEFDQLIKGSNALHSWKLEIEGDYEQGKRVNKTKYNKIRDMYEDRRAMAYGLLQIINRNSRVITCMPPHYPPPPAPRRRNA